MNGTIDETFEYRMVQCIKRRIRDERFVCSSDLFDYLWDDWEAFGQIVIESMVEWMEEDEWFDKVME